MFSSNDLIQLVFANENDIYYGSDLLKLDLDQYLWFKLHSEQYSAVYFISPENGGSIKTFGDASCRSFDERTDSGFWPFSSKKNQNALGKWMLKQLNLKSSAKVAFVCSLGDFCNIFKDPVHRPVLSAMASSDKRTGIIVLTLPANVDKSARLLLESPVFEYLNETAITDVRGGELRDMFTAIFKIKHERGSCCFANEFTNEAALGVLTNVVIEDMSDCPSRAELGLAAEYLSQYVNNPALHEKGRVLKSCRPDMLRSEVYLQLKNDEKTRKKLFNKVEEVHRRGGLRTYMEYLGCEPVDLNAPVLHITRDPDSCAGRCLAHRPPKNADSVAVQGEPASNILSGIRNEAMQPKNRPENEKMAREAKEFLREAETEAEKGDLETYRWAIYSVRLCMQWLYVAPDESEGSEESSILSIIKNLHNLLSLSSNYYTIRRNLSYSEAHMGYGKMSAVTMQQTKSMVLAYEKKLELLQDLVPAKIMKLSTQGISSKEMKDLAQSLSDEIDDVKETIGEHENCSEQIIPPGGDDDENFVLEASDYDYHIW